MIPAEQPRRFQDGVVAGVIAGVLAGLAAAWLCWQALGRPTHSLSSFMYALWQLNSSAQQLQWQLRISSFSIIAAGLLSGGWIGWLASAPAREKIHVSGGRLVDVEKFKQSNDDDILFSFAGLDFSRDRVRRSIFLTGSIGGGKTVATLSIIKNLMMSNHRLLIVDGPKGDYSRELPVPRGTRVAVMGPWLDGLAWDVAADVRTPQHARELARALIPVSDKDPLWGNAAGMILTAILIKLMSENGEGWGWKDLSDQAFQPIENLKEIAEKYYPPAVQAVADAESKTTQSIAINLVAFLADVYELGQAWGGMPDDKRISFEKWWRGEYTSLDTIILQGSAEFSGIASAYIGGIVRFLAQLTASPSFEESKTRKNVIVIDEFAQLGRIDKIEKFLEIGRSKGCSLVAATQTFSQVREIYGQNQLSSWLSMIGTKVFLRAIGADEQEMIVREAGTRKIKKLNTTTSTVDSGSRAAGDQTTSRSWQDAEEPVLTKSDLVEIGPDASGVTMLISGFASDIIKSRVNFSDLPPKISRTFDLNADFNRIPPPARLPADSDAVVAAAPEIVSNNEPAPVSAVSDPFLESDYFLDDFKIVTESAESSVRAGVDDEINPAAEQIVENVATEVISQALGIDHHIIDAVLNIDDALQDPFEANNGGASGGMTVAAAMNSDEISMKSDEFIADKKRKLKLKKRANQLNTASELELS